MAIRQLRSSASRKGNRWRKGLGVRSRIKAISALIFLASTSVPATASEALDPDSQTHARALVTARDRAIISSETPGTISAISIRPGSTFTKGQVLIQLDCTAYKAHRKVGEAEVTAAQAQLKAQKRLFDLKSASALDVELAQANLARAEAQRAVYQVNVDRCLIHAPFDGRVIEWHAQPFESVEPGQDLVSIVGTERLDLEVIVPSFWLRWLKPGQNFDMIVDETGSLHQAEVQALGAMVDAVSQTISIHGSFKTRSADLVPGMSGTAVFQRP